MHPPHPSPDTASATHPVRHSLASLLLVVLCLFATASGSAAETSPKSATGSALRVGVSPIFPPMVFKQGKQLAGVEIDLAQAFATSIGRTPQFVELPWEDQLDALQDGRIDIVMSSMSITQARRYVADFSRPYLIVGQMALVRLEDQNRYVLGYPLRLPGPVGVLRATTGEFLIQRDFPKSSRKVFKNEADAVRALQKGSIDLFVADSTLVWFLAGKHAADGLAAVRRALSEEPLAWAVRRGDENLLNAANKFLETAAGNGNLEKTLRRWAAIAP